MSANIVLLVGATEQIATALENSYARAFDTLGWQVVRWSPDDALRNVARLGRFGNTFSKFVHVEPWVRKANLELLRIANDIQPQLIFVIATSLVRAGTLAQIRVCAPRTLIYWFYPDTPHNLGTERIQCIPFFDRVITPSPGWKNTFERLGSNRVDYLPFAGDTAIHKPVTIIYGEDYAQHDLAFVGNWRTEREAFLEYFADLDLIIWGSDYWRSRTRKDSPLRKKWGGKQLSGLEFAQACANTKIMFNIIDPVGMPGPNMRTFEQPACGAFSLVTRTPAILELFNEGTNIACFSTPEEARSKIEYYLEHEEARSEIARASYQFIIEGGHTYVDRVKQLMEWLENDNSET